MAKLADVPSLAYSFSAMFELEALPSREEAPFAVGEGRMARLVRGFDWTSTSLGAPSAWPAELKTAVGFILESRFPAAIVWGPSLTTIYNDAFRPILGDKPEALGRPFSQVWSEAWPDIGPLVTRAFAGEATYIEDYALQIDRRGQLEPAWFTFCYSPLRLADGTVAGMMDTVIETTSSVKSRLELEVLNDELRHRLKNTLASVQSIAWQTLRGVSERAPVEALMARIVALGTAHDVLFWKGWTGATMRDVATASLSPVAGAGRIRLDGPDLPIGARGAVALALLLHELATNALKYGALSTDGGEARLTWALEAEQLHLRWREVGGPPVAQPARLGFGSRLIDMGLSPRGRVERRYATSGFEADLHAPIEDLMTG